MSDKQTTMSNDTLEKIVCLRNSRMAVTALKGIYVDEAKHVAPRMTSVPAGCPVSKVDGAFLNSSIA